MLWVTSRVLALRAALSLYENHGLVGTLSSEDETVRRNACRLVLARKRHGRNVTVKQDKRLRLRSRRSKRIVVRIGMSQATASKS